MEKTTSGIKKLRQLLPDYSWISAGAVLLGQFLVYYGTRLPLRHRALVDLATALDEQIPFWPVWVVVYVLSFASWLISFYLILRERRAHVYRVVAAYLATLAITAAVFLLLPGTLTRPEVTGQDAFSRLTRFIYQVDTPNNLCPSLHVVCSYYCWRGLMGARGVPRWYVRFNFVFLLLVCCSILFVKQHVLVDIPAAVLAAELPLQLARRFRWERIGFALEERIENKKHRG